MIRPVRETREQLDRASVKLDTYARTLGWLLALIAAGVWALVLMGLSK